MSKFNAHGYYTISNAGGYLVEVSSCGDSARLQESFGDHQDVSDWIEIDYDHWGRAVIDPGGYDIYLDEVMRI